MPFQSKSQIRACFANQKRNPDTTWNCKEWLRETPNTKKLPDRKIYTGPRGGKYYITPDNKKVYIK